MTLNKKGFAAVELLLTVIALVLIGFVAYYVYHAQHNADKNLAVSNTATKPSAKKIAQSQDIKYDPPVVMEQPSDVDGLKGAPQSFKDFANGLIAANTPTTDPDCGAYVLGVSRIYHDFALGTVGVKLCGGAQALWGKVDGKWQQVFTGQQTAGCDVINKYKVPAPIYPECFSDAGIVKNPN
jgi:Flp pilus assembly pilin Flp